MTKMPKKHLDKLLAIYDAIGGMVSEQEDPFDSFYNGGTDALLSDFEAVLENYGVQFAEQVKGRYFIASYINHYNGKKEWGVCTDKNHPNASWCLTGFVTTDDALAVIHNHNIFNDYNGKEVEVIDTEA